MQDRPGCLYEDNIGETDDSIIVRDEVQGCSVPVPELRAMHVVSSQ